MAINEESDADVVHGISAMLKAYMYIYQITFNRKLSFAASTNIASLKEKLTLHNRKPTLV